MEQSPFMVRSPVASRRIPRHLAGARLPRPGRPTRLRIVQLLSPGEERRRAGRRARHAQGAFRHPDVPALVRLRRHSPGQQVRLSTGCRPARGELVRLAQALLMSNAQAVAPVRC